jgi:threonyl-tRNA synthetase
VQLDFQLPIRFNLQYWNEEQQPLRPVIVHRAILGSVERMYAILCEHYAQKWPLWLSPRQAMVVPISAGAYEYAEDVRKQLRAVKFHVEADLRDQKMQKKVSSYCCLNALFSVTRGYTIILLRWVSHYVLKDLMHIFTLPLVKE